jgi:hypothetical protein
MTTVRLSEATQDQLHCTSGCKLDFDARLITPCAGHRDTHHAGQPDRYTCDAHLHAAIDRERGALIVPFRH